MKDTYCKTNTYLSCNTVHEYGFGRVLDKGLLQTKFSKLPTKIDQTNGHELPARVGKDPYNPYPCSEKRYLSYTFHAVVSGFEKPPVALHGKRLNCLPKLLLKT